MPFLFRGHVTKKAISSERDCLQAKNSLCLPCLRLHHLSYRRPSCCNSTAIMILDSVLEHIGNTPLVSLHLFTLQVKLSDGLHLRAPRLQVRADRLAREYGLKCNLCELLYTVCAAVSTDVLSHHSGTSCCLCRKPRDHMQTTMQTPTWIPSIDCKCGEHSLLHI